MVADADDEERRRDEVETGELRRILRIPNGNWYGTVISPPEPFVVPACNDAAFNCIPLYFVDGDSVAARSCGIDETAGRTPRYPSYVLLNVLRTVGEAVACVESENESAVVDFPNAVGTQEVWSDNLGRLLALPWVWPVWDAGVGVAGADDDDPEGGETGEATGQFVGGVETNEAGDAGGRRWSIGADASISFVACR